MPLAATMIAGLTPGPAAPRGDAAAPERSAAASAFDALLGDPVAPMEGAAVAAPGRAAWTDEEPPAAPAQIDTGLPAEAPENLGMTGARPVQSAIATGQVAQIETDCAPSLRNPGAPARAEGLNTPDSADADAKDAVQTPAEAPQTIAMPAAGKAATDSADGAGAPGQADAPAKPASVNAADSPVAPAPASDLKPGADGQAEPAADAEIAVQTNAPAAQAPAPDTPGNAAPVRRESETRRAVKGADEGKPGGEAARPSQPGAKAQASAEPAAPAQMKAGTPDMPAAQRSADAFQALLQAQTRPGAETGAPRAPDLPLDPSGDTGLRGAPDRAAEILRTPSVTQTGAPPRFAPQTVQTLAAQIVRRQGEGGRVFDIRLDPPELGRVGVRLEMGKDQLVKAMLSAERPDTLQELQRTARDLERALAEAGLTLAENGLSFSLGGERGERDTPGFETPGGTRSVVDIDVARPGAPVTALYGFALARAAGLDIQA